MHDAHEFLKSLTIVLGVAAVTTVVFQRLRQPVVLGYIIAGLIVGPHVPIPLVADPVVVQTLSELGVILLMFSLGLEFSLRRLAEVGPTAGLTALLETSFMIWLGFTIGRLLGWTGLESLFAGAVIAISSTTIIAQAFEEQGVTGKLRQLVLGILIAEDLIAVLLIAVLTGVASGSGLAPGPLAATVARLVGFLVALITVGLLLVPRAMRAVSRLNRRQTTLVASIGICFAVALLAQAFGYSVALGAFLAGSLVAESGEEKHVAHLVEPVRDVFAAVFFVSVGMLIDPRLVARHWQGAVKGAYGFFFTSHEVQVRTTEGRNSKVLFAQSETPGERSRRGSAWPRSASSRSLLPVWGWPCTPRATSSTPWPSRSQPSPPCSRPG